ncbi:MAG: Obg family GTPase CgtA [Candidatus Gottesmanbacteria bacterium]|nr:Obg family GTPase CgtA [Candidatus Gottesmanbacteria bacterium]
MLVDNINLIVKAGNGGNGAATLKPFKGGPDGGDGGNGGNIFFVGSTNITDLREFRYKKKIVAKNGGDGARKQKDGRKAENITILIPTGTKVTDVATGDSIEITEVDKPILIAQGGLGGRGNINFKSSVNQTPKTAEKGEPGQERELRLELRLIAQIGLTGLPNAGKSSLLTVLTNARPAVAAYPFTTLDPTVGMLGTHPIADIPGLIEGASRGKGLGIEFLKHIEKTKILLHCIDVTHEDPMQAYKIIREEFKQFDPTLLTKPEYIILTKIDLADATTIKKISNLFTKEKKQVFTCSVYDEKSIESLKKTLVDLLSV